MEREKLTKLYEAIKSDNEKLFTSFMLSKSDLNICFGRFPILSLCYLYKSYKILLKYEKYLMPINKFDVVPEYFQIYKDFKRYAKKSLRLYACSDKIVYPLEMLAVLDDRKLIKQKYKFLFKNEEILQNMQKIYTLNKKIQIIATREKFECEAKKFNLKQKIIAGVSAFVFVFLSIFSFAMVAIIKNLFGIGTERNPVRISTASELVLALKKGGQYYVLENDIVLANDFSVSEFSGTLIGNDKTIVINGEQSDSLIQNLSGTIDNVNFEFEFKDREFVKNFAILTQNNTGIIKNCDFYGIIKGKINSENIDGEIKDIFVSGVATENSGIIDGVQLELNSVIENLGETNAYLSGIVGVNKGSITNSKTLEAKFEADTVDLSGIAGENYGTISACENNTELDQISSKEWHPNCAGISMQNYSVIDTCVNNAKISSKSTRETADEEQEFYVYAGGVVCNNYKKILNSRNYGMIFAEGHVSVVFAAGIAALNVLDDNYSFEIQVQNGYQRKFVVCEIDKSKSTGNIYARSKKSAVYAGGISAVNNAQVNYSGFEGVIDADTNSDVTNEVVVFAGGVVGSNNHALLQNCYAKVEFENKPAEVESVVKAYGAVVGFIGNSKNYYQFVERVELAEAYNYITSNYYVSSESVPYSAYGRLTTYYDFLGNEVAYSFEKIGNDENYFIKVEDISDIPEEVRIYE